MTQCGTSEMTQDFMEKSLKNLANIEGLTREQAMFKLAMVYRLLTGLLKESTNA